MIDEYDNLMIWRAASALRAARAIGDARGIDDQRFNLLIYRNNVVSSPKLHQRCSDALCEDRAGDVALMETLGEDSYHAVDLRMAEERAGTRPRPNDDFDYGAPEAADLPAFGLEPSATTGMSWLTIRAELPTAVALQIVEIIASARRSKQAPFI